jgi:hypothetical protein
MDNYRLLTNINNNFNKLFVNCKHGMTYTALSFTCSPDIDALIVLNQIIDIILQTRQASNQSNQLNVILGNTLNQIITIKCKEYVEKFPWNSNLDTFISSFYVYVNNIIDPDVFMN